MKNRRDDAIYFLLLLFVGLVGYFASTRTSETVDRATVEPDFETGSMVLPEPYFTATPSLDYRAPRHPNLRFGGGMESALVEVRSALLASSIPTVVVRKE